MKTFFNFFKKVSFYVLIFILTVTVLNINIFNQTFAKTQNDTLTDINEYFKNQAAAQASYWKNHTYTNEEIEEIKIAFSEENIKKAFNNIDPDLKTPQKIKLSDNFYLEVKIQYTTYKKDDNSIFKTADADSWYIMKRSTVQGKNIFGIVLWDLILDADFVYDGVYVDAIGSNAYGHTYAVGWSCSDFEDDCYNITPSLAKAIGNGHYEFHVGVDPVSITIQSFTSSTYLYCDENGD